MNEALRSEDLFKYRETLVVDFRYCIHCAATTSNLDCAEATLNATELSRLFGSINPGFGSLLSGNVYGSILDQSHA